MGSDQRGLKLDVPFDFEENPYCNSVRLHYRGFYMEVTREAWYYSIQEPAMLRKLTEDFMNRYYSYEKNKYSGMIREIDGPAMPPWSKLLDRPLPAPKPAPKQPSKLLLLCN